MTVEYKRKSPEEMIRTMTETLATHYEEKEMFHQMIDDVAEGCISTIVERNAIHEIETERRFEVIEGEDGSVTYQVIQEYRKKPTV